MLSGRGGHLRRLSVAFIASLERARPREVTFTTDCSWGDSNGSPTVTRSHDRTSFTTQLHPAANPRSDEPNAGVAHVRIWGRPGRAISSADRAGQGPVLCPGCRHRARRRTHPRRAPGRERARSGKALDPPPVPVRIAPHSIRRPVVIVPPRVSSKDAALLPSPGKTSFDSLSPTRVNAKAPR